MNSALLGSSILGATGIISLLICCIYIFGMAIGLALTIFWVWMMIDALQRKDSEFGDSFGEGSQPKIIWLILMLVTGGIASVIYYFLIYKKYPRK